MIENEVNNLTAQTAVVEHAREISDNWYIEKFPLFSSYVEAKIFEIKNENSTILISPKYLNFKFNSLTLEVIDENQEFTVLNKSSHPVKIFILPTQTEYFVFSYIPVNWLAPGMHLLIKVTFRPTMPRQYKDWLRVCSNSECNLMVPITSSPEHPNSSNIPERINFGCVPIGKMAVYKMTLLPVKNTILKFLFVINSDVMDCCIEPSQGRVEDVPVNVEIKYCPTKYITALIPVHLYLPPLMMTPHCFTIEATTKPMGKSITLSEGAQDNERPVKNVKQKKKRSSTEKNQTVTTGEPKGVTEFAVKALTHHDINILLLRKEIPERDPQEQLGPNGIFMDKVQELKTTSLNHFKQIVKQLKEDDKKARLFDNQERIFDISCSPELRKQIITENLALREEYQLALNPVNKGILPIYIRQKTLRKYDKECTNVDKFENNLWHFRYQKLWMFIQAGRSVLIKMRMLRRLGILKSLTPEIIKTLEDLDEK